MKKFVFVFIALTIFASCKDSEADKKAILPESNAKINHVSIIADEMIWNGEIGDSIRKKFAAPVDGLPQEEPLFNLNQYPNPYLLIFNRWGELVYENSNYQNDWSGTHYKSGEELKEGIYYYLIDPKSAKYNYEKINLKKNGISGKIQLIR